MGYKEHERVSPGFKSSFEPVIWAVCFALRFVGKNNYYQRKRDNIEKNTLCIKIPDNIYIGDFDKDNFFTVEYN